MDSFQIYCTGCGLCHSAKGVNFARDEKGFPVPELRETDVDFCRKVCPASGRTPFPYEGKIWGNEISRRIGWASDPLIRKKASSGGALTALSLFLLETNRVDGVIGITVDPDCPYRTMVRISSSREDVLSCCGSRYSISSPLMDIDRIPEGKAYAFIGKPCDVLALRNYAACGEERGQKIRKSIRYYLSFFCAGEPSEEANLLLLRALGCRDGKDCCSLTYRGNGWPGMAAAVNRDGRESTKTYAETWGKILGRDIRKVCRVCSDGTGDAADVACGDAWYPLPDGTPDFSEHEGRNLIFTRTTAGEELVGEAAAAGYLTLDAYPSGDEPSDDGPGADEPSGRGFPEVEEHYLEKIQNYQFIRKSTLRSVRKAYRLCGLSFPLYEDSLLKSYEKCSSLRIRGQRFLGTVKRHMEGKI